MTDAEKMREMAARVADASACGACRADKTFGNAIRALPLPVAPPDKTATALPDMGGADAMREMSARRMREWPFDLPNAAAAIRALPLPAATPEKTTEALEMARRAIAGTLEETFGSIRLSYPLDRLLREALAAIDAAKGGS